MTIALYYWPPNVMTHTHTEFGPEFITLKYTTFSILFSYVFSGTNMIAFRLKLHRSLLPAMSPVVSKSLLAANRWLAYPWPISFTYKTYSGAIITWSPKFLQKTAHSSPVRARYGVSFLSEFAVWPSHNLLYTIWYYTGLRYNHTVLYVTSVC